MRVLVCPDKFKGSLTASQAAEAIARGFSEGWPEAECLLCPLADGGEGTLEVLVRATGGRLEEMEVTGPLGERRKAFLGICGDGRTAVVEMAAASGLELIPPERRNPLRTTTAGTGDLIRGALDLGHRRIIVGIGGSGTNDGGTGMASALGARFLDQEGNELPPGGGELHRLERIDLSGLDTRALEAEIIVASDVDNPLLGPEGASRLYGPQKGASPEDVELLERGLTRLAEVASKLPSNPLRNGKAVNGLEAASIPGAGAAGGLGFGLVAFLGADIRPGIEVVMEAVGFKDLLSRCRLVITGEGRLDAQTAHGKTVNGVARQARGRGIPVLALAGELAPGAEELRRGGVTAMFSVAEGPLTREDSLRQAYRLLARTSCELARLLRAYAR
ncbi:MAG: glycerate kinase [Actinomycetota bacterium]